MTYLIRFALFLAGVVPLSTAQAHEYWIEPDRYVVAPGDTITGHLVNGQRFDGTTLPFIPGRTVSYDMWMGMRTAPVEARAGDVPALSTAPLGEGLNVITYQSTAAVVTYDTYEEFDFFAEHKDFPFARAEHTARGLPETDFVEAYTRFSKALIGVGNSRGGDFRTGLEMELVALTNPYTDPVEAGFRVQLFYLGAPRPDAQLEVFEKAPDGTVEIRFYRTDADGIGVFPVRPGHSYLVDNVVLREPTADVLETYGNAVWETLWAALTFGVPE